MKPFVSILLTTWVLLVSPFARAQLMTATFTGESNPASIERLIANDSTTSNPGTTWIRINVGLMNFTRLTGASGGDYAGPAFMPNNLGTDTFVGYCIEPRQFVSSGQNYTWSVVALDSTTILDVNAAPGAKGWLTGYQGVLLGKLFGKVYPSFGSNSLSLIDSEALQVAVWEIIRELPSNSLDVYNGNIQFRSAASTAAVITRAQDMLTDLSSYPTSAINLVALHSDGAQDMIVQLVHPVPEPSTYGLIGAGALAACTLFRRYKRRS